MPDPLYKPGDKVYLAHKNGPGDRGMYWIGSALWGPEVEFVIGAYDGDQRPFGHRYTATDSVSKELWAVYECMLAPIGGPW